MANIRIINDTILKLSDTLSTPLGMIDDRGLTGTEDANKTVSSNSDEIFSRASLGDEIFTMFGYTFLRPSEHKSADCLYYALGEDKEAEKNARILCVSLEGLRTANNEKQNKNDFMKNVILDNILIGDLLTKANDFHITYEMPRLVYLIKSGNTPDNPVTEIVQGLYPNKNHDFIIKIDASNCVLIKELKPNSTQEEIESIAKTISTTLISEALIHATIGIGTVADNLTLVSKSYKDACVALEVGKVFDTDKDIINYDSLGVARLIYHLPTTLCELFLNEVFKKESIDVLDREIIYTIQQFFENNLNVSETSRKLYVHRNTLVYRLDKVQKLTGLDLRIFEHAVVFKIAMMVKKYLTSNPIKL